MIKKNKCWEDWVVKVECTHKTSEKKETHAFIDWSFYLILHIRLDYSIYKHPLSYTHKDWRAFKQEQKKRDSFVAILSIAQQTDTWWLQYKENDRRRRTKKEDYNNVQ